MNTPSKEALEASSAIVRSLGITDEDRDLLATIIDRHFAPLRRDNATLAGRLTAAELERDGLGARAEQAEALLRETEAVAAQGATQYAELNRKFAELPALRARVKELEDVLARHAAGEPANVKTCEEVMRRWHAEECDEPDLLAALEDLVDDWEFVHGQLPANHKARTAIDAARREVQP